MTLTLFIHLIAIGIWAGCVATEVVCELEQKHVKFKDSYIASLHWSIDKFVEIPAIFITAITGYLMLNDVVFDSLLTIKISAGVLAIIFNLMASYSVYKRYKCLVADNEAGYLKYDLIHERIGVGCVLFILVAIISGGYHFTGY
jgi:putative copper export protein